MADDHDRFARVLLRDVLEGRRHARDDLVPAFAVRQVFDQAERVHHGEVASGVALVVTVATARLDRRLMLCALMVLLAALYIAVPPLPPLQVTKPAVLRDAPGGSRNALIVTCLIVTAHFATYTDVTPFLRDVVRPELIGLFLLIYGAAGRVGNLAAGTAAARNLSLTFAVCAGLIATATLLMPVVGRSTAGALVLLVVWGLGYGGIPVCSMSMFAKAAPRPGRLRPYCSLRRSRRCCRSVHCWADWWVDAWSVSAAMVCGGLCAALTVGVPLWTRTQEVLGT